MKFDWSQILTWAVKHASDVPAFVSLVLAAVRAEGAIARIKAIGELFTALQAILDDFPMPSEQVFGADNVSVSEVLAAMGVSELDSAEFTYALASLGE